MKKIIAALFALSATTAAFADQGPRRTWEHGGPERKMPTIDSDTLATLIAGSGAMSFDEWIASDEAHTAYQMFVVRKAMHTEEAVDGNQKEFDDAKKNARPERPRGNEQHRGEQS